MDNIKKIIGRIDSAYLFPSQCLLFSVMIVISNRTFTQMAGLLNLIFVLYVLTKESKK